MHIYDEEKYYYAPQDLGLSYNQDFSEFRLWTPAAESVELLLYKDAGVYDDDGEVKNHEDYYRKLEMLKMGNSLWYTRVDGNLELQYYMYRLRFPDGSTSYAVDPYARATSANGQRTAIVDLAKTDPVGFTRESTKSARLTTPCDAIIYELHIEDFSINEASGVSPAKRGKYLAFTEKDTSNSAGYSTGLQHLQELGVTHVQIMPCFDFALVNELRKDDPNYTGRKYNWGYDPLNYNVPEGSYSSDPSNPMARISELKQAIQAIHAAGMGVIMDVVYNHTWSVEKGPFEKTVPGFYYRQDEQGKLTNGSGCGNELRTEAPMVRKYIVDSLQYWVKEYGVDGFRFDLMGLIDIDTMQIISTELHMLNPGIIILGEPWQAGGSPLPENKQSTKGSQRNLGFGVFNDNLRNALKGDSDGWGQGFATGNLSSFNLAAVLTGIKGAYQDFTAQPGENILYVTAHDNLSLWDKVVKTQGYWKEDREGFIEIQNGKLCGNSARQFSSVEEAVQKATLHRDVDPNHVLDDETVRRSVLANGIILTGQGVPFIQAGDEFLRSKFGDRNSYASPAAINQIRWDDKSKFIDVFKYYQGLITLRRMHPAFRMNDVWLIESKMNVFYAENGIIAFMLRDYANGDSWKNILVIYNANNEKRWVGLPYWSKWQVVVDQYRAGVKVLRELETDVVEFAPLSVNVLYEE